MNPKQVIVAIEGIDCVGKKTLAMNLIKKTRSHGYSAQRLSFPDYDDEPFTKKFIKAYLSGQQMSAKNREVFQAFCALNRKLSIMQAESDADLLILDRYVVSSLAYRSADPFNGTTKQEYQAAQLYLEHQMLGLPKPDLYLLLTLPLSIISARLKKKKRDSHEKDLAYLQRVQQEYLEIYHNRSDQNWCLLPDKEISREEFAAYAWRCVAPILQSKRDGTVEPTKT